MAAARRGSPGRSTASAMSPGLASLCGVGGVMAPRSVGRGVRGAEAPAGAPRRCSIRLCRSSDGGPAPPPGGGQNGGGWRRGLGFTYVPSPSVTRSKERAAMGIAGYGRISSDEDGSGEGVDNQRTWFERWAAEHHPGVPTRWYFDNDLSGAQADRGGFEELRAA